MNGSNCGCCMLSLAGDFLLADGTPSSKVIVEGANLFLTPEARHHARSALTNPAPEI